MLRRPFVNPFAVLAVALLLILAARPVLADYDCEPVDMDSVGCGELLMRSEAGLIPLPPVSTEVRLEVNGPLIAGTVIQAFVNPTDRVIGATYVFPMPEGAAVHAMEMWVGERRIVSIVKEKAEARRTYEAARAEGRRAALVESARPNLFTTSVANICPGDEIRVELRYLDRADYADGVFSLAVPLSFTPRYIPPRLWRAPDTAADVAAVRSTWVARGDARYPTATIHVDLTPGVALSGITSESHDLDVTRDGDLWRIGPDAASIPADRDFLLAWRPVADGVPAAALFTESREDGVYALLMVVPAVDGVPRRTETATETVFLIDVSGSMQGASIEQARAALISALDRLGPDDRFALTAFQSSYFSWRRGFSFAEPQIVAEARGWVKGLRAGGGTEMRQALLNGLTTFLDPAPDDVIRARRLVLITDAAVGNEDELLREAVADRGDVRLHVVGIGHAPNRYLVKRLAGLGGGLSTFVSSDRGAENAIDRFLERIARPQLLSPVIAWEGAPPVEGYPARLPELFPGEPLLWSGRFPAGTVPRGVLSAELEGRAWSRSLAPDDAPAPGTAVRWARDKVDALMADLHGGRAHDAVKRDVVEVALAHGLVTRFTSRVAVEEAPATGEPAIGCRMPNGLPHGTEFAPDLPLGGTSRPLLRLIGFAALGLGALALAIARLTGSRS